MDKGTMLKLKCADLIAMDRAGTPRDDGYHRYMREHYTGGILVLSKLKHCSF